ncbi:hypothetical protein MMC19_005412 [Ptychographa xylographoides]|nr:hypothetical protein [Ptychographa xylographoides]
MTGKWPSTAIQQAYTAAAGTLNSVPATVNTIATTPNANNPAAPGAVVDGPFSVSYQFQTTGLTRFAPMQQRPGTVITQTNTSPLFPTSLFTVAAEYLPTPSIITTVTQSMTISATSLVNTASSAPMPSNDMQKYLARWKD